MPSEIVWTAGLFLAVVVTAALVNRFAPLHRPRIRRVVVLFAVYAAVLAIHFALKAFGSPEWAQRMLVGAELIGAFTVVNVAATATFSVALPRTGVLVPMIASDILVGLGYILATLGVLSQHGLNPTGAFASAAVVSAVLAISLQSTLGNILGGVALQLDGSIHEGDWIQFENGPHTRQGRVRAIRWRHTVVETRDWSTIIVPNSVLLANNIIILGKRDGESVPARTWIHFNVDFRYPPSLVNQVVSDALASSVIDNVASEPAANCVCMDFGRDHRQSFATYGVRFWLIDISQSDQTCSRVRTRVFSALRRADIPMALPATTAFVQVEDEARKNQQEQRRRVERLTTLRDIPLFRELNEDELETLADGLSPAIYTSGERITRQGAVAHFLYIITKGTAEVRAVTPEGRKTVAIAKLTAPDIFGEMGLMTGEPRIADVVATSDVECYRLGKETFEEVLLQRPEIAQELSEKLAQRRVALIAARDGLDAQAKKDRESIEQARILGGIKSFFGL
jgi:CRP-like cAMP-binding protein/small-conductance mechanosensitive channel